MLFSRPLIIDSLLSAGETRRRIRAFATSRELPDLEAFRRQLIVGWKLSEAHDDFLFQPEYGDSLDVDGARFVGLVEPTDSGSRIRGRTVVSPLMRVVLSVWMLAVVVAVAATLREGTEPTSKVLGIALVMLGAAVMMVRYSLWSASRLIEARLRQSCDASRRLAA